MFPSFPDPLHSLSISLFCTFFGTSFLTDLFAVLACALPPRDILGGKSSKKTMDLHARQAPQVTIIGTSQIHCFPSGFASEDQLCECLRGTTANFAFLRGRLLGGIARAPNLLLSQKTEPKYFLLEPPFLLQANTIRMRAAKKRGSLRRAKLAVPPRSVTFYMRFRRPP